MHTQLTSCKWSIMILVPTCSLSDIYQPDLFFGSGTDLISQLVLFLLFFFLLGDLFKKSSLDVSPFEFLDESCVAVRLGLFCYNASTWQTGRRTDMSTIRLLQECNVIVFNRYEWRSDRDSSECPRAARSRRHIELLRWNSVSNWPKSDNVELW